jgi:hypothetical protein
MSLGRAARLLHASTAWTRCIHHEAQAATGLAAAVAKERGSSSAMEVFDRQAPCTAATPPGCTGFTIMHPCRQQKQAHRDRAAALRMPRDPLLTTITDRLLDRLDDCVAKFPTAVILGGAGELMHPSVGCSSLVSTLQQHPSLGAPVIHHPCPYVINAVQPEGPLQVCVTLWHCILSCTNTPYAWCGCRRLRGTSPAGQQ